MKKMWKILITTMFAAFMAACLLPVKTQQTFAGFNGDSVTIDTCTDNQTEYKSGPIGIYGLTSSTDGLYLDGYNASIYIAADTGYVIAKVEATVGYVEGTRQPAISVNYGTLSGTWLDVGDVAYINDVDNSSVTIFYDDENVGLNFKKFKVYYTTTAPREATENDVLLFSETGLVGNSNDRVTIDGVSFDADTTTYTFTNVDFISKTTGHGIATSTGDSKTINFNFVGTNTFKVSGDINGNAIAFSVSNKVKAIFGGTGTIKFLNTANCKSEYYDTTAIGLQVTGELEISEGVTVEATGGAGTAESIGVYVAGTLINKGTLVATGSNSEPVTHGDFGGATSYNGFSKGLKVEGITDGYLGIYKQVGANSRLDATASKECYESIGIEVKGKSSYRGTFNITDGTVNAKSEGCIDVEDDARSSFGFKFTASSKVELINATINAETKCTYSANAKKGYLSVCFAAAYFNTYNENWNMDENSIINLTAPKGINEGYILTKESSTNKFFVVPEGSQEIFVFGLEANYPDECTYSNCCETLGQYLDETWVEDFSFVKTPTDGTLTIVSRESYFNALKNQIVDEITNWDSTIAASIKTALDNQEYDYEKLMSENVSALTTKMNEGANSYCQNAIDVNKNAEVELATDYKAKFNELEITIEGKTCSFSDYNTLKDEFDAKLAALRKPSAKSSFPVALIVIIPVVVLLVAYIAGYVMWSKGVKALSAPFFSKIFGWINKLLKK